MWRLDVDRAQMRKQKRLRREIIGLHLQIYQVVLVRSDIKQTDGSMISVNWRKMHMEYAVVDPVCVADDVV